MNSRNTLPISSPGKSQHSIAESDLSPIKREAKLSDPEVVDLWMPLRTPVAFRPSSTLYEGGRLQYSSIHTAWLRRQRAPVGVQPTADKSCRILLSHNILTPYSSPNDVSQSLVPSSMCAETTLRAPEVTLVVGNFIPIGP